MNRSDKAISIKTYYTAWIIQNHITAPFLTRNSFYWNKSKQDNLKFLRQFAIDC